MRKAPAKSRDHGYGCECFAVNNAEGLQHKDVAEEPISDFGVLGESKFMESSLEQFIKAADAFPVVILISDVEGRIVRVNQKAEMMFGYECGELIGQTIETLKAERYRELAFGNTQIPSSAPNQQRIGATARSSSRNV